MHGAKERGYKKHGTALFVSILISISIFALPSFPVHAATLKLSPTSGSYVVGDVVTVTVLVSSQEEFNAASGAIEIPSDVLRPVSISKDGSVVDIWLQEPAVDGRGHVLFEGLIIDNFFSGNGKLFSINLEVLGEREVSLAFVSGLVLASDGLGTNVLDQFENATLTLLGGPPQAAPEAFPATLAIPLEEARLADIESLLAPRVLSYSTEVNTIDELTIQGITYPNSLVYVDLLLDGNDKVEQYTTVSDAGGNFVYQHDRAAASLPVAGVFEAVHAFFQTGSARFWLRVENGDLVSEPTQAFEVSVASFGFGVLGSLFVIAANTLIFIGAGFFVYARIRKRHVV